MHLNERLLEYDQFLHPMETIVLVIMTIACACDLTFTNSFSSVARASSASISSSAFSDLTVIAHQMIPQEDWIFRSAL